MKIIMSDSDYQRTVRYSTVATVVREMQRKTRKIIFSRTSTIKYRTVSYRIMRTVRTVRTIRYRDCTVIVKKRAALLTRSPSSAVPMAGSSGLFWIAQSR